MKKCQYCGKRSEDVKPIFDVYLCDRCEDIRIKEIEFEEFDKGENSTDQR